MSLENFNEDLIRQVNNDIYLEGRDPEIHLDDQRYPGGVSGFFVFTKYNEECGVEWEFPDLVNGWYWVGGSWLGDWRENQFSGPVPLDNLYQNEMNIRSRLNEYLSRGILRDFKIRYRFPSYQRED